jgi:GrpB-like predicted nucleotidyltransferase (UPF0157 family)
VGSNPVPGLAAKPNIDIPLIVPDSANEEGLCSRARGGGFLLNPRGRLARALMFKGPDTDINLHVFSEGCPEIERVLVVRDRLRTSEADRLLYERRKRELAALDWTSVQNYADAKTIVVDEIIARARHEAGS